MLVVQALRDLLQRICGIVLIVFALICALDDSQVNVRNLSLDKLKLCAELGHDVHPALVRVNSVLRAIRLLGHNLLRVFNDVAEIHFAVERDSFQIIHENYQKRVKRVEPLQPLLELLVRWGVPVNLEHDLVRGLGDRILPHASSALQQS